MARAPARPGTDATPALTGAARRRSAGLETTLSIVGAERISVAGNWSRFPALRVPKGKCDEADDCKSSKDDQHGDALYESAWLPSTGAYLPPSSNVTGSRVLRNAFGAFALGKHANVRQGADSPSRAR